MKRVEYGEISGPPDAVIAAVPGDVEPRELRYTGQVVVEVGGGVFVDRKYRGQFRGIEFHLTEVRVEGGGVEVLHEATTVTWWRQVEDDS
jgi:hypothetical protein